MEKTCCPGFKVLPAGGGATLTQHDFDCPALPDPGDDHATETDLTACCGAYTSIDEFGTEYCKACYEEVV